MKDDLVAPVKAPGEAGPEKFQKRKNGLQKVSEADGDGEIQGERADLVISFTVKLGSLGRIGEWDCASRVIFAKKKRERKKKKAGWGKLGIEGK